MFQSRNEEWIAEYLTVKFDNYFEEKIKEIGRMISGVEITDLTKKHAEELLQLAEINKKN